MARGINKVILIGNLGADPEVRYMPSGGAVSTIRLATTESWRDKQSGETKEQTEWHRVVFFNRLAEIAGEYLRKGSKVYIEGSIRTRKWQGQDGQDRYTTEVIGREMQMLDSKGASTQQATHNAADQSVAPDENHPAANPPHQPAAENIETNDFNDDIPF